MFGRAFRSISTKRKVIKRTHQDSRWFSQKLSDVKEYQAIIKKGFEKEIPFLYKSLDQEFNNKLYLAKKNQKKLIISVVEHYSSRECVVLNMILTELAKKHGIKHLAVDMPEQIANLILTNKKEVLEQYSKGRNTEVQEEINAVKKAMSILTIDLPFEKWKKAGDNISNVREDYMANQLIKLDENVLCMLSTFRLWAFRNNRILNNMYEIAYINPHKTTYENAVNDDNSTSNPEERFKFLQDPIVKQACITDVGHQCFISLQMVKQWTECELQLLGGTKAEQELSEHLAEQSHNSLIM